MATKRRKARINSLLVVENYKGRDDPAEVWTPAQLAAFGSG
jgi:hypothetical protein